MPLVLFYGEVIILFTCTQWAWEKPAFAILMLFPSYCLMTCRHIICSVTKMKFNWRQLNPLFYLAFPLNSIGFAFTEWQVAAGVFGITFVLFMQFVVEVIGQITGYLGIYCLTIKHRK
jgi:hypothetical protein